MQSAYKTDTELIEAFRHSSTREHAFREILGRYHKKVYWLIRRIVIDHDDADDVSQNTFIKVWEKLDQFREDSKLYTWIFRIATNEALNFINRKKNTVSMDETPAELLEKLVAGNHFDGNSAELKLQQAILTLPEKQRLVFNMKYYDDMKYEDISEVVGTSVGALKASYHHAVKKIEDYLAKY